MKTLKEIAEQLFPEKIRHRAYQYFRDGRVKNVELTGEKVRAQVRGTYFYDIEIAFDTAFFPSERTCDCPYGGDCKHIAAVFYHLNSIGFFVSPYYRKQVGDALGVVIEPPKQTPPDVHKPKEPRTRRPNAQEIAKRLLEKVDAEIKESEENSAGRINQLSEEELARIAELRRQREIEQERLREEENLKLFRNRMKGLIRKPKKAVSRYNKRIAIGLRIDEQSFHFMPIIITTDTNGVVTSVKNLERYDHSEVDIADEKIGLALSYIYTAGSDLCYLPKLNKPDMYFSDTDHHTQFGKALNVLRGSIVYYVTRDYPKLAIDKEFIVEPESAAAFINIQKNDQQCTMTLNIVHSTLGQLPIKKIRAIIGSPIWIRYKDSLIEVSNISIEQFMTFGQTDGVIQIAGKNLEYFEEHIAPNFSESVDIRSDQYSYIEEASAPFKRLYLEEDEESLNVRACFVYGAKEISSAEKQDPVIDRRGDTFVKIKRDPELEAQAIIILRANNLKHSKEGAFVPKVHPYEFILDNVPQLQQEGFEIFGEEALKKFKVKEITPRLSISVESGIDWFEVKADLIFENENIPLSQLLSLRSGKQRYFKLKDGSIIRLANAVLKKYQKHLLLAETDEEKLKFSRAQIGAVEALLDDSDEHTTDQTFQKYREMIKNFHSIEKHQLPENLKAELRNYQKHGFDWIYFLQQYGFGGILADDMGLGKTIQVIAVLLNEKKRGNTTPNLVLAPTSVVFNWIKEIERFAPDLKVLNHTGQERKQETYDHLNEYDIILSSYGVLLRDYEILKDIQFHYIVLDESQKIKNPITKSAKYTRHLKADHRLCLSGTPVENNLLELWSQSAFINPGMLGSLNRFQSEFVRQIQRDDGEDIAKYLQRMMYPFLLRRTKEVVAKELPPKTTIIHYCEMDTQQKNYYEMVRDAIRDELMNKIDEDGIERSGMFILSGLTKLRQICDHPRMVNDKYNGSSAKFEEFKEMLEKAIAENQKVLVFSQYVRMLEILRSHLDENNIPYEYLTGSTTDRPKRIKNFQTNPAVKVFLISLKAGGFGINLTAANTVFLIDPWWNPAVENQAADRTHRIGQTKNIFIYKYITRGTVEEKILELQKKKQDLVSKIITSEKGLFKSLTKKDIAGLFS